ncbi:MAG: carbohydrate-binding protein [Gemmiger sp.]
MKLKLKIIGEGGTTLAASVPGETTSLAYMAAYREGDVICLEADRDGTFCEIQLDDAMQPAIVRLAGRALFWHIPFGEKRSALSPKAFMGNCHLLTARLLEGQELYSRRNLAKNPYDGFAEGGLSPHASANVETRDEAVFAARNAIDGIFANHSHGGFPYGSWGINRRADAQWTLEFGAPVCLDELRLTLRSDFPHDSYWGSASVVFSDGSTEQLFLKKTDQPQIFPIEPRTVTSLTLKDLVRAKGEDSPFPALTQLEAWGSYPLPER